jgi:protein gp37
MSHSSGILCFREGQVTQMADGSGIEWTEATWNPTTGCDKASPGCDNCYALTLANRLKAMGSEKYQRDGDPRTSGPGFGLMLHPDVLDLPKSWRAPRTVFVDSMSDLFHPEVPIGFIQRVFAVMEETPQHTYQVLTKRSKRLRDVAAKLPWPSNVWMGVSVETSLYRFRIDHLRLVPAQVRFLSLEPLLGSLRGLDLEGIHWVIVGGESGPGARIMNRKWAEDIRDQCASAGVPFFFKQWGGRTPKAGGRHLDGELWDDMPRAFETTAR